MGDTTIRDLLTRLKGELQTTELDAETRALLAELDADIHQALNVDDQEQHSTTIMDSAKQLETRFAADHPVAERVVRELIDALARMGI